MHEESLYALRALRAGALGYITKLEGSREVVAAIRKVMGGQVYLSESMQQRLMLSQFGRQKLGQDPVETLTDRELEVLQLLGRGFATRRIADELGIGIKSVEVYRARIKDKLDVNDGTELLFRAIQWAHGLR
jgi:DNA-binding NarL/FixJ family response regulator